MSSLALPYPGYSWSMSHHVGPATNREQMFELLQAAYIYSGDANHSDRITEYLVRQGVLTANVRQDAGRAQTWRDYQQILPELGLIVSTRFTDEITITPAGLMLLDGLIGYSELITTQCLRYQYPNGHKLDFSNIRAELEDQDISLAANRIELDARYSVQVKPAVLILRILLELKKLDIAPVITARECTAALIPIKTNQEWQNGLNELLFIRRIGLPDISRKQLRDVQEWFRLLNLTDIFEYKRQTLSISQAALENYELLQEICEYHEAPQNFWIPPATDNRAELAFSWFQYFGNPDILGQWVLPDTYLTSDYIRENYPAGMETFEEEEETFVGGFRNIDFNLRNFEPTEFVPLDENINIPTVDATRRIAEGQIRRQRSSRLHEEIVVLLAGKLQSMGFQVSEDRRSVDLLATSSEHEVILEVKTVNRNNFLRHMRLGVGQLSEYRYRRQLVVNHRPQGILVLSSTVNFEDWQLSYFETDIKLGLVSLVNSNRFYAHTVGNIEQAIAQ